MVSVVIPTYNRAAYLRVAIESVLNQTYRDFEIIIVDDASTDNTSEIVKVFGPKLRYILQEKRERSAARNTGIKNALGDIIAFLDSDDMWTPQHLESCIRAFKMLPTAAVAFSGSYLINSRGIIIGKLTFCQWRGNILKKAVSSYSFGGCNASSCLVKKDAFAQAGYFDEELSGAEDWEMWARLAAITPFVSSNEYTAKIRFHEGKTSINAEKMAQFMTTSLNLVYQNSTIAPIIARLRNKAFSSLYCAIAVNFYATGDMRASRAHLRKAFQAFPLIVVTNKYFLYTLSRTFLGKNVSSLLRRVKWVSIKRG